MEEQDVDGFAPTRDDVQHLPLMLTEKEVAAVLQVSVRTLAIWRQEAWSGKSCTARSCDTHVRR